MNHFGIFFGIFILPRNSVNTTVIDKAMVSDGGSPMLEGIISATGVKTGLKGENPRSDSFRKTTGEERRVTFKRKTLSFTKGDRIGTWNVRGMAQGKTEIVK